MSLGGALNIGRTALIANQAALEVTGNNLANISTENYHRQRIGLGAGTSRQIQQGIFVGTGVQINEITRMVDQALEGRIRDSLSQQGASAAQQEILSQIEALENEFTDNDLSTQLAQFFDAFSELANTPDDSAVRNVVINQGRTLASFINNLSREYGGLRAQVDAGIEDSVRAADDLLSRIEDINQQIAALERGQGGAHGLRDERDSLLAELSEFLDISVNEQPNGAVDVFVGSSPLILNGQSRGLETERRAVDGQLVINVTISADKSRLIPVAGRIGALVDAREAQVNNAIEVLDGFANELIHQVNRVHSQAIGERGYESITSTNRVVDSTTPLNRTDAGLNFEVTHGSFVLHVAQNGLTESTRIVVDLDDVGPTDTSLDSLVADINANVANVSAAITSDGRLKLDSVGPGVEISFSEDSSGFLAAMGINTYFAGSDAGDISVNSLIATDPGRVAAAANGAGKAPGNNEAALTISQLRSQPFSGQGQTVIEIWNGHIEEYAVRLGQANQAVDADRVVSENLRAQREAVSGVNVDEEAINLLAFQRAYQGSARFLQVVDDLLQTLLQLV